MTTPLKPKLARNHTTVRLPADVREAAVAFAVETHRTLTDVIAEALRLYLASPKRILGRGAK